MVQEVYAKLIELRPGRTLFCRHWVVATSPSSSTKKIMNLVCVHGTAASHDQFLPLLRALETTPDESVNLEISCWMYDAVGCGQSPALPNPKDYKDIEQVQDLAKLVETQVLPYKNNTVATVFLGHSYSPTWIFKYLQSLGATKAKELQITGLVLASTGLGDSKLLLNGGPALFRLPLWLLKCLQPLLTKSFLKLGFSPSTHQQQPHLIQEAIIANNHNDMRVVCHYYQSHDWLTSAKDLVQDYKILLLHGVDDGIIPIQYGQELANHLETSLVSIENASHVVLMEQPEQVAKHVRPFLMASASL